MLEALLVVNSPIKSTRKGIIAVLGKGTSKYFWFNAIKKLKIERIKHTLNNLMRCSFEYFIVLAKMKINIKFVNIKKYCKICPFSISFTNKSPKILYKNKIAIRNFKTIWICENLGNKSEK